MHSISKKNLTAIDHILRSVVRSIGGSQFNAMAIQYGKLPAQRQLAYVVSYNPVQLNTAKDSNTAKDDKGLTKHRKRTQRTLN